jgi:hypothetical protein
VITGMGCSCGQGALPMQATPICARHGIELERICGGFTPQILDKVAAGTYKKPG